ncbi:potassium-transporting ATPase subunit KdpA [Enterococcus gallinarum]|nr:potassium-transporting ATPase subunit KdpA [Enterococcus gallinarum]
MFFKGCFSFCITDFSSPFRVLYQDDHDGETPRFVRFIQPIERGFYRLIGSESQRKMSAKRYLISVLGLGISSLLFLTVLLMVQGWLPGGAKVDNLSFDLALNTAVSFITNTNWQAYSGELALSNSTQVFGLTVQNFLSAAVGLAVLCAFIRGLVQKKNPI